MTLTSIPIYGNPNLGIFSNDNNNWLFSLGDSINTNLDPIYLGGIKLNLSSSDSISSSHISDNFDESLEVYIGGIPLVVYRTENNYKLVYINDGDIYDDSIDFFYLGKKIKAFRISNKYYIKR